MRRAQRPAPASALAIRNANTATILRLFLERGVLTRAALVRLTGLAPSTITSLTASLLADGLLAEIGPEPTPGRTGRPRVALRLAPERRLALGVHFGVGVVTVGLVDLLGRPGPFTRLTHPVEQPAGTVVARVAAAARELLAALDADGRGDRVLGVGVGASGLVDVARGVNRLAPRLGWRDVPLGALFSERLGLPVRVDNNVRAMALAETLFGTGRTASDLAFVYVGRGLGAGLVIGRRLFRGSADGAGEVGHMTVVSEGGHPCHCGNTGCLETLVSRDAFARLAARLDLPRGDGASPRAEDLVAAARAGHPAARRAVDEAAAALGIGVAALVNIVSPELIVLGGLAADAADLFLPAVAAVVRGRVFPSLGRLVRVQPTALGPEVGLIGAAALVLDGFFDDPLGLEKSAVAAPFDRRGAPVGSPGMSGGRAEPPGYAVRPDAPRNAYLAPDRRCSRTIWLSMARRNVRRNAYLAPDRRCAG